jgi:hypothetical protein
MPIEIKELHIRINLNENKGSKRENDNPAEIKKAVEESMSKMMEMLKNKKER